MEQEEEEEQIEEQVREDRAKKRKIDDANFFLLNENKTDLTEEYFVITGPRKPTKSEPKQPLITDLIGSGKKDRVFRSTLSEQMKHKRPLEDKQPNQLEPVKQPNQPNQPSQSDQVSRPRFHFLEKPTKLGLTLKSCPVCFKIFENKNRLTTHLDVCLYKSKRRKITDLKGGQTNESSQSVTDKENENEQIEKQTDQRENEGDESDRNEETGSQGQQQRPTERNEDFGRTIERNEADNNNNDDNDDDIDNEDENATGFYQESNSRRLHNFLLKSIFTHREQQTDFYDAFNRLRPQLKRKIRAELKRQPELKFTLSTGILMRKNQEIFRDVDQDDGQPVLAYYDKLRYLQSRVRVINEFSSLDRVLDDVYTELSEHLMQFTYDESGYSVIDVVQFTSKLYKYSPLNPRIHKFQLMPNEIAHKHVIVPINTDENCLIWVISLQVKFRQHDTSPLTNLKEELDLHNHRLTQERLEFLCGDVFTTLSARLKASRMPLVPAHCDSHYLKKYFDSFGLKDFCINLYALVNKKIICLHAGDIVTCDNQLTDEKTKFDYFHSKTINILSYGYDEISPKKNISNAHAVLCLNIHKVIGKSFYGLNNSIRYSCARCSTWHRSYRTFLDHSLICKSFNEKNQKLKFLPKITSQENQNLEPKIPHQASRASEFLGFLTTLDLEGTFKPVSQSETENGKKTSMELVATMGSVATTSCLTEMKYDTEAIIRLKKKPFPLTVRHGPYTGYRVLKDCISHAKIVFKRLKKLKNFYFRAKIDKEDRERFLQTTHCFSCKKPYNDTLVRQYDHSHIGLCHPIGHTGFKQEGVKSTMRASLCPSCNRSRRLRLGQYYIAAQFAGRMDYPLILKQALEMRERGLPLWKTIYMIPRGESPNSIMSMSFRPYCERHMLFCPKKKEVLWKTWKQVAAADDQKEKKRKTDDESESPS